MPKFNEKLYDRVVEHILEEPKRINMDVVADYAKWLLNQIKKDKI